jgi:hypothetical protein
MRFERMAMASSPSLQIQTTARNLTFELSSPPGKLRFQTVSSLRTKLAVA